MSFLGFTGGFFLDFARFFVHKPVLNRSILSVDNPHVLPKPRCGKRNFLTPKRRNSTSPWISLSRDSTQVSMPLPQGVALQPTRFFEKKRDKKQTWGRRNLSETHREAIAANETPRVSRLSLPRRKFSERGLGKTLLQKGFLPNLFP